VKNLFDPEMVEDTKLRILRLHAGSERQWGNMTVGQTLAHATAGIKMATGEINPKRAPFPGNVVGLLIKPLVFGDDKPMRRNSPTVPEMLATGNAESDFERERAGLIAAINEFAAEGAACCSKHPHPFFGVLNPEQWAVLMYKHVDHHLRQFGV
jgi:hypothetical protein